MLTSLTEKWFYIPGLSNWPGSTGLFFLKSGNWKDYSNVSLEKTLMLEKTEGRRRRGRQRMRWLDGIISSVGMSELQKIVGDKEAWRAAVHGITKSQTRWATEQQHSNFVILTHSWLGLTWSSNSAGRETQQDPSFSKFWLISTHPNSPWVVYHWPVSQCANLKYSS